MTAGEMRKISPLMPPPEEFAVRRAYLAEKIDNADAFVFFSPRSIFYLSGCALSSTERPVILLIVPGTAPVLFVPRMELEHALYTTQGCRVEYYREYPDEVHPMERFAELMRTLRLEHAFIAADAGGYASSWGYRGPSLKEVLPDIRIQLIPHVVPELRMIKSRFEQMLMRESAKWSNLEHSLLQKYTRAEAHEIEICQRAAAETVSAMLSAFGPGYRMSGMDKDGARAVFRGQVGANAAFPHAVTINARLKKGDGLVTGVNTYIQGYFTEMERVLFVGEPSAEQRRFYELAVEAQNIAVSAIRPGVKCSEIDREVRRFYKENGLEPYWRHHTGHSIGQEGHEIPFFDIGDNTVLMPGMCMTAEPGLYVEGLGGFRLSDTILVTETGAEQLTYYTKELEDIIC